MHKEQDRITKQRKHSPYQVEDQVWLEGTNLKLPYDNKKLSPKRYGPFRVAAKISETSYQLDLPPMWKIHPVFHANLLTPYKETETHGPNFLEPPPDIIEGEPEWEVEQIISERRYRNKKQFLIRWKDYSPAHDSWTDEADIHAPELIKQYYEASQNISQPSNTITQQGRRSRRSRVQINALYGLWRDNPPDSSSEEDDPSSVYEPSELSFPQTSPQSTQATSFEEDPSDTNQSYHMCPEIEETTSDSEGSLLDIITNPPSTHNHPTNIHSDPTTYRHSPTSPTKGPVDPPYTHETANSPIERHIDNRVNRTSNYAQTNPITTTSLVEYDTTYLPPPNPPYVNNTVDILLTDFPVTLWPQFQRNSSRLCGATPQKHHMTGTSPRGQHIPLWTVSYSGCGNTNDTRTTRSSDSWPRQNLRTTSRIYAKALEATEQDKPYPTKRAPSYPSDMTRTWMTSSGSYSPYYDHTTANRPSTTYVEDRTQRENGARNANGPSALWTTNGHDVALTMAPSARASSTYADPLTTPSTSSSSTPNYTIPSPQTLAASGFIQPHIMTLTSPSGRTSWRQTRWPSTTWEENGATSEFRNCVEAII